MYNALLILCFNEIEEVWASSKIIICESTPVPIAAMIPAIEGKSKFLLNNAETPKMIATSDKLVNITARDNFIFLYLKNIINPTAKIDAIPAIKIVFMNSFPSNGEIVSSFSICNLKGSEPVIITVWSCFMFLTASL